MDTPLPLAEAMVWWRPRAAKPPAKARNKISATKFLAIIYALAALSFFTDYPMLLPSTDVQYLDKLYHASVGNPPMHGLLQKRYIQKINLGGRLGNQILEWALKLGLAKIHNLTPCFGRYLSVNNMLTPNFVFTCPGMYPIVRQGKRRTLREIRRHTHWWLFLDKYCDTFLGRGGLLQVHQLFRPRGGWRGCSVYGISPLHQVFIPNI